MKYYRILLLASLSAAAMSACDSGTERIDLQQCSAASPCDDTHVCVNHYCVSPCGKKNPCPMNLVCSSEGICIDKVIAPQTPAETACSNTNPCTDGKICVSGQCLECSEDKPCGSGKKCDAGICVIDADDSDGSCTQNTDCARDYVCQDNKCIAKCTSSDQCQGANRVCSSSGLCIDACYAGTCGQGMVCEGKTRLCVPGMCSWYDDCEKGYVCDEINHVCLERCTAGSCSAGTVCSEDGFCVPGECSQIDAVCTDPSKTCDRDAMKCVDKCSSNDDCGTGKLCDITGLCVTPCKAGSCDEGYACLPNGLCIQAECSVIDPCSISYKTCVENKCIDKCRQNSDCGADQICNVKTGICDARCTADSCGDGQVCSDAGICTTGICSSLTPCPDGLICTADNQCVQPGKLYNECYFYRECGDCSEKYDSCLSECQNTSAALAADLKNCQDIRNSCSNDYESCEADKTNCDKSAQDAYDTLTASCEADLNCQTLKNALDAKISSCAVQRDRCTAPESICQKVYDTCISAEQKAFDASQCSSSRCIGEFDACEKNRIACESRSKSCPEGKQCNAYNQCVDSKSAGGLGLGMMCSDGTGNVQNCADGLSCIVRSSDNLGFCKSAAFEHDLKTCSPGSFKNRCEGNVILECDDETGRVFVQDCKTNYVDYSMPTTGKFYGDDFYCLQNPNTNDVTCAQACGDAASEKFICGWDTDDTDIDYSDRYVCQVNADGYAAYFHSDSEICSSTCDYYSGKCD